MKAIIPVQEEELCTEGITKPSEEAKHPVTMLSIARQLQKPFSCNTESDNSVINKEITEPREGTTTQYRICAFYLHNSEHYTYLIFPNT